MMHLFRNRPKPVFSVAESEKKSKKMADRQNAAEADNCIGAGIPGIPVTQFRVPPTLGGKLVARVSADGKGQDLFYPASDNPTFRWTGEPHQIKLLGQSSPKNINVLFDLAKEKGIGMPQIVITGTPEFQMIAVAEAARRGIPVDTAKLHESARQAYQSAIDDQPLDNCIKNVSAAYESADRADAERQRQREADREKNDDRADDRQRERMKMG